VPKLELQDWGKKESKVRTLALKALNIVTIEAVNENYISKNESHFEANCLKKCFGKLEFLQYSKLEKVKNRAGKNILYHLSRLQNYELPLEILAVFFHSFSFIGNLYVIIATKFYSKSFQIILALCFITPFINIPIYTLIKNR
jgi:hypothetical protein